MPNVFGTSLRNARAFFQRYHCYQERQTLLSDFQFWRRRQELKPKLLFTYKKKAWFDHELYSMILVLKRNFANIDYLSFSPDERPRNNPGLSSESLLRRVEESNPDIVFAYDKMLSLDEVEYISSRGIRLATNTSGVHSFYCGAPPMTQPEAIKQLRKHNWYLVPHAPHISRLQQEGINAIEFSLWYDPEWFCPLKLEKAYDCLFVGDFATPLNRNRLKLLEHLSHHFSIAVASAHDPQFGRIHYIGATTDPRQLNKWLNQARLVVGSDRLADIEPLNSIPEQFIFYDDAFFIRQRTYLTLGAGACYLVERHPEIEKKFVDGEEIVLWDSYEDLISQIHRLLHDRVKRERIGRNGHFRALAEHSTPVRVNQLLQIIGALE